MRKVVLLLTLAAMAWPASDALAQSNGMFGNRSLGSTLSPGMRNFAAGDVGAFAGEQNGVAGQVTGSERFVRGNRNGNFVGTDSGDIQQQQQQRQQGTFNAASALRNFQAGAPGAAAQFFQQQQPAAGTGASLVRVRLNAAFAHPEPQPGALRATLQARLQRMLGAQLGPETQVTVEGRTVVLTGSAASQHDRELAEILIGLEPGVGEVQNLLRVAGTQDSVPQLSAP